MEKRWGFQGDVNIFSCEVPKDANRVKKGDRGYILAKGETTGHAHIIEDEVEIYEKEGTLYIKNNKEVNITHEEHNTVILPPGEWKVKIAQEYDHFAEEARQVRD